MNRLSLIVPKAPVVTAGWQIARQSTAKYPAWLRRWAGIMHNSRDRKLVSNVNQAPHVSVVEDHDHDACAVVEKRTWQRRTGRAQGTSNRDWFATCAVVYTPTRLFREATSRPPTDECITSRALMPAATASIGVAGVDRHRVPRRLLIEECYWRVRKMCVRPRLDGWPH